MSGLYEDPTLKALKDKLNAEGPAALKNRYYIGDPLVVPESQLPICFITRDTTTISTETNFDDRHAMSVVLNVVTKFSRELNQSAFMQAGISGLYQMCEERNADHTLKEGSIAYALRKNETLDQANNVYIDMGSELTIDYNLSPPSRRGYLSSEAVIRTRLVVDQTTPGALA